MAIKDRISGLFNRGSKKRLEQQAQESAEITPSPATEEERQELLQHVGDGFTAVGQTLERLDSHLEAGIRNLEGMTQVQNRLPGLIEGQRELIERTNNVAEAQQQSLEAFTAFLQERDEAQTSIVTKLEQIDEGLRSLKDHDRSQLDLLLQFQRSGRRMVVLAGLIGALMIMFLLALLIILSLRPDLLGLSRLDAQPMPAATPTQPTSSLEQQRPALLPQLEPRPAAIANTQTEEPIAITSTPVTVRPQPAKPAPAKPTSAQPAAQKTATVTKPQKTTPAQAKPAASQPATKATPQHVANDTEEFEDDIP